MGYFSQFLDPYVNSAYIGDLKFYKLFKMNVSNHHFCFREQKLMHIVHILDFSVHFQPTVINLSMFQFLKF